MARHLILLGGGMAAIAGCTSTQQQAAWLQLNSARIRVSQGMLRPSPPSPTVRVVSVALVPGHRGTAIVVTLRNESSRPVGDLPLLVGTRIGHRRHVYLNATAGAYFDNHVPGIAGHARLTWVLRLSRRLAAGARPFAQVGLAPSPAAGTERSLPLLRVAARRGQHRVILAVDNPSSVPQYQLTVYAVAHRAGRVLAAGEASIGELDPGTSAQVPVQLVGNPAGAALSVQAPPTMFK